MEWSLLEPGQTLLFLLQYRNTPSCQDGRSPAQKLYGHPTQDTLPAHRRSFSQEWQQKMEEVERQTNATQESITTYYNTHAYPLTEIEPPHQAVGHLWHYH